MSLSVYAVPYQLTWSIEDDSIQGNWRLSRGNGVIRRCSLSASRFPFRLGRSLRRHAVHWAGLAHCTYQVREHHDSESHVSHSVR